MGPYARAMSQLRLEVTSPDKFIKGQLLGEKLEVSFMKDSYRRYDEDDLEDQLAQVAKLLIVGRRRARFRALSEAVGYEMNSKNEYFDSHVRRYLDALSQVISRGESPNKMIRVRTAGLRSWDVEIESGTLDKLDEDEFLSELSGAVSQVMQHYRSNVKETRRKMLNVSVVNEQ